MKENFRTNRDQTDTKRRFLSSFLLKMGGHNRNPFFLFAETYTLE